MEIIGQHKDNKALMAAGNYCRLVFDGEMYWRTATRAQKHAISLHRYFITVCDATISLLKALQLIFSDRSHLESVVRH